RASIIKDVREPEDEGIGGDGEEQRVPGEEAKAKAQPGADNGEGGNHRAFGQAIEMRRKAGAGNGHANSENKGGDNQSDADRTDMGRWRQTARRRGGQPGAENGGVANGADGKRHEDRNHAGSFALFNEVAKIAVKAEPTALQHHAKGGTDGEREGQRAAFR